jgi:hypothetical protein
MKQPFHLRLDLTFKLEYNLFRYARLKSTEVFRGERAMRLSLITPWVAVFAILVFAVLPSCDESDSETVAGAIEDRLTDALDFDDGKEIPGSPPPENEGNEYPQIAGVSAPPSLTVGTSFEIRITPDLEASLDIKKVMVYVYGAESYIEVKAEYRVEIGEVGEIVITGTLTEQVDISGDFEIKLALINSAGESGEWALWELMIPEETDDPFGGDYDFDFPFPLTCTNDAYACDDGQMRDYLNAMTEASGCQSSCQALYDSANPETAEAYSTCYTCCVKEDFDALGEEIFVECQACLNDIGASDDGETIDPVEARSSAQEDWDNLQEATAECAAVGKK